MRVLLLAAAAVGLTMTSATMWAAETNKSTDRVLCKNEQATGTRFQRRMCTTGKDRERRSQEHKKGAAELIDRPILNPVCAGPGC